MGPTQRDLATVTPARLAQVDDAIEKLKKIQDSLDHLAVQIEDIQVLLTPCDGEKDGERCVLPDRHQGRHSDPDGTEWFDEV